MDSLSAPIHRGTVTEAVIDRIRQMILEGEVEPGGWLPPQTELADSFGVGLSTVREATRGLALMGILNPQAGRGTQVSPDALVSLRMMALVRDEMDALDGSRLHEARRLIEAGITELAAARATEKDVARMEAALKRMEEVQEDDSAYIEADLAFHRAVARAAKNEIVEEFYQILLEMLSNVMRQMVRIPGLKERGISTQKEILESIRTHDQDRARRQANRNIVEWDQILAVSEAPEVQRTPTV